ncbi:ferredoxin-type protein NapF [Pseudoruegeria sp. SHC-113]|uniref:ferredoxin-type protein NapF n=1 Tax=Pseudoruegeria sp. SHC-113 TaxID=2855439 RepID=UPI0021BB99A5|nr:ferredoxin-type protein NapF [Pseudoruegeria sp. SHC-113]
MARAEGTDLGRRSLLMGRVAEAGRSRAVRPPWATEASVSAGCTSCGACMEACPEAILLADPDGQPFVDFSETACTFCGACAVACEADVFAPAGPDGTRPQSEAFAHVVTLSNACLMTSGVECRLCADHCDARALRFDYAIRPAGGIRLEAEACTGCGACIAPCPTSAIEVRFQHVPARAGQPDTLKHEARA